jgi:VWFA-related protein
MKAAAGVASIVLLAGGFTLAQPPSAPPVFGSRVNLVYVTVTVSAPDGHPVGDLARSSFEIIEDGRPRPIAVFSRAADSSADERIGLDAALLLDTSESMSLELRSSHEAALAVLDRLPLLRRRTILSFDTEIRVWRTDAEPRILLGEMLGARTVGGATALHSALVTGIDLLSRDGSGRAVLLVLTDGRDWGSPVSQAQLMRAIAASNVAIYPLPFGSFEYPVNAERLRPRAFLERIAEESGGLVLLPEAGGFERVLDRLVEELSSQYVIGFAPTDATPGRAHRVAVRVDGRHLRVRYRERYMSH